MIRYQGAGIKPAPFYGRFSLTGAPATYYYKLENDYCKSLINKELPYTIGGGIGQSRLCMYFLKKVHIGEVQASLWPNEMVKKMEEENVILL